MALEPIPLKKIMNQAQVLILIEFVLLVTLLGASRGLENNFKKLFRNNNENRSLKTYDIRYIVKSINLERLQNHPVKLSNKQLENIFF